MAKKPRKKSKMTASEIKDVQRLLLAKRNEILGNVSHMENETLKKTRSDLSSMPIHMADIGSDNFEMENTVELMGSERKILLEIDDALNRIKEGVYGICEGNGEYISKERLKAIPWARHCVTCAGLMEKGLLVKAEEEPKESEEKSLDESEAEADEETDDEADYEMPNAGDDEEDEEETGNTGENQSY